MSVRFGPGLEIISVSSNAKATLPAAIIENFPRNTLAEDILLLLRRFRVGGDIDARAIQVTAKGGMAQAVIRFEDALSADAAIEALNGHRYHDNATPLAAKTLKPTFASESATQIYISWFPPSKSGRLFFQSATEAEAALALAEKDKGVEVRGRRIKCIRQQPRLDMPRPYSVFAVGLDIEATEEDLCQLFGCDLVKMKESTALVSSGDAEAYIRSLFDHQPVKAFKLITAAYENRQRAVVNFETAEDARQLHRKLHDTKHDFLGPTACSLNISLMFSATFRIQPDVFLAIRDEINALVRTEKAREKEFGWEKSKAKGDDAPARLKILDKYRPVTVHVNGSGRPAVVRNKAAIQKLLRGEVVCDEEGRALWDPALVSAEGRKLVRDVKDHAGIHVWCDLRNRCVTLYGSAEKRAVAREMLAREYQRLLDLQHEISLKGANGLLAQRGGLAAVQKHLGVGKVIVDRPGQRLLVRCSPAEIGEVRRILLNPMGRQGENKEKSNAAEAEDCLICFTPAEDGIKMEPCSHMYCRSCARDYIKSTIETRRFPITCVGNGDEACDAAVPIQLVRELLSKDDADRLFEHGFTNYIQSRPQEYHFCPTPDCSTVFNITSNGKVITCSSCFVGICTTCKTEAHDGQTCEEYQVATDPELDEKKLQEWKKEANIKSCPRCKVDIEKNGGCMHIKCICQAHICWNCLREFPLDADVYAHLPHCRGPPDAAEPEPEPDHEPYIPPFYRQMAQNLDARRADLERFVLPGPGGDWAGFLQERREREARQLREAEEHRQREALRQYREIAERRLREARQLREAAERRQREAEARKGKGGFCSIM